MNVKLSDQNSSNQNYLILFNLISIMLKILMIFFLQTRIRLRKLIKKMIRKLEMNDSNETFEGKIVESCLLVNFEGTPWAGRTLGGVQRQGGKLGCAQRQFTAATIWEQWAFGVVCSASFLEKREPIALTTVELLTLRLCLSETRAQDWALFDILPWIVLVCADKRIPRKVVQVLWTHLWLGHVYSGGLEHCVLCVKNFRAFLQTNAALAGLKVFRHVLLAHSMGHIERALLKNDKRMLLSAFCQVAHHSRRQYHVDLVVSCKTTTNY